MDTPHTHTDDGASSLARLLLHDELLAIASSLVEVHQRAYEICAPDTDDQLDDDVAQVYGHVVMARRHVRLALQQLMPF